MALTITVTDIQHALTGHLVEALKGSKIPIVFDGQEAGKAREALVALVSCLPGGVYSEEKGGPHALSRRVGTFRVSLLLQAGKPLVDVTRVADNIESAFRLQTLDIPGKGCVICEEPYSTNAGKDPNSRWNSIVTVPWHVHFREVYYGNSEQMP